MANELPSLFQPKYQEAQEKTFNLTKIASFFKRRELQANDDEGQTDLTDEEILAEASKKDEFKAVYPDPFLSKDQVRRGGFFIYLAGIMYAFLGISLVT